MNDEEAMHFATIENYNDLIAAVAETYAADPKYANINLKLLLDHISQGIHSSVCIKRIRNIENLLNERIQEKYDADSNILLKVSFLHKNSFLKWPRFVLMVILFIAVAIFVLAFFPLLYKVIMNVQPPYFYHWLSAFIMFVLICWIPVFKQAFIKLKSSEVTQ